MAIIQTVLGPIKPYDLGITQMHEHLVTDVYPTRWGYNAVLDDIEVSIQEVQHYKNAGGGALIEATMRGAGRDPEGLRCISETTGVHIIMSTAFLWAQFRSPVSSLINSASTNDLAEIMSKDILIGVDGTGIKAGCIGELGAGYSPIPGQKNYLSPLDERLFRAAARAQKQTGALIFTDTYRGSLAHEIIDLFDEEGADLGKVIIGHIGEQDQVDYYEGIASRGVCLGIDHVGHSSGMVLSAPDIRRADVIVKLIAQGFEKQIVLSQDLFLKEMWHFNGGIGYDHLLRTFVPLLRQKGVTEPQLNTMLVANPARLLTLDLEEV